MKERITHSFRLAPLLRSDVDAYLDFRMRTAGYRGPKVFTPQAVRRIVKASEGLTRRVNILADKSLLAAFADNEHGITARHVDRAVRDSEFYSAPLSKTKIGLAAGGVAAGLALGLGLHFLLLPSAPTTQSPAAPVSAAAFAAQQPAPTPSVAASSTTAPTAPTPQAMQATAVPMSSAQAAPANPVRILSVPAVAQAREQTDMLAGAKPGSKDHVPPAPAKGELTRARFIATQDWLRSAPGDQYSIQLLTAGARDLHRIEDLLARVGGRNLNLSDFYVYGVKIDDQQNYRVAYGLYPTLADVNQGIQTLPQVYKQFGPYQRSVERMRSQNRQ